MNDIIPDTSERDRQAAVDRDTSGLIEVSRGEPRLTATDHGQPGLTIADHGEPRPAAVDRDLSQYTMTVDEALILFERAGLTRNKRTVERYCEHSQIDAVKLVAAFGPTWYLNPESVEGKIKKLQQFEEIKKQRAAVATSPDASTEEPDMTYDISRPDAVNRDTSRQPSASADPMSQPDVPYEKHAELLEEFNRVRQQNVDLKIDNRELVGTVKTLVEEQKEFAKERREMITERKTWMAQIGEMTARMFQLSSGGHRTPPPPVPTEVIHDRVIEHRPEPAVSTPLEKPPVDNLRSESSNQSGHRQVGREQAWWEPRWSGKRAG